MTDYLGSLFGQGSGVRVGSVPGFVGTFSDTPGYTLNTGLGGDNAVRSILKPTNTPYQMEMTRRFPEFMSTIDTLKSMAAPNASLFRTAALGQINAAESSSLGNLRQQLANRGLQGANFADATAGQIQAEFGLKRAQTELAAAQQEMDTTAKLTDFQNTLINQRLQEEIQLLGIASNQAINVGQLSNQNAAIQAQMQMAQAQIDFVTWQQNVKSGGQLVGMLAGGMMGSGGGMGGGGGTTGLNFGGMNIPSFGATGLFGGAGTVGSFVNLFGPSQSYSGNAYANMQSGFGGSPLG